MGRRVKRRGVQEHAACTMAARYQLPRGWFPVLPIALGGRLTSTGTQRRKDAEKFVQKKLCASATLRHDRCKSPSYLALLRHERDDIGGDFIRTLPVGTVPDLRINSQARASDRLGNSLLIVLGKYRVTVAPQQKR